jgi:peptidoglycan/LPS O-acetylase OafA/YrhL
MHARTAPAPAQRGRSRLPSLDGLRAVAILLVLVSHCQYAAGFPAGSAPLLFMFFDGELGVRIFFVISGFIITRLLLDEELAQGGISLRRFYLRRTFRILPIYFAYLGLLALLSLAGRYADSPSSWLGCLTFTRNMMGRGDSATVHFWSLAIEEQFYLCWPLLFCLLGLGRRRALAAALLLSLVLVSIAVRSWSSPAGLGGTLLARLFGARSLLRYADSLALGCLGAFLHERLISRERGGLAWSAALLLVAEQLCDRVGPPLSAIHAVMPALQAATAVSLLLCLLTPSRGGLYFMLNRKFVMRVGVLSYSLYVWHFVFLSSFAPRACPWPLLQHWTLWWIPAFAVAMLSYEFLEVPFLRLRRKFGRAPADVPA